MPKQSIADLRRNEILTTFYEIAKVEGLEKTSFAMIAQRLEIQPSLIVHYFKNREELITSLIQFNLDQYEKIFVDELDQEDSSSEKKKLLRVIGKIFSKKWNDLFDDGVFYNCYSLAYRNEEIRKKFRDLHLRLRSHIQDLIKECKDKGILQVENEVILAEHISNLMDGAYYFVGVLDKSEQTKFMQSSKQIALSLLHWKDELIEAS